MPGTLNDEMKVKFKEEYISRPNKVLRSKLSDKNSVKALNSWAVSVMHYRAGINNCTKDELEIKVTNDRSTLAVMWIVYNNSGKMVDED